MEGKVEHMTVEAPVRAEDQQEAFVRFDGLLFGFFDFGVGVGVVRIDVLSSCPTAASGADHPCVRRRQIATDRPVSASLSVGDVEVLRPFGGG